MQFSAALILCTPPGNCGFLRLFTERRFIAASHCGCTGQGAMASPGTTVSANFPPMMDPYTKTKFFKAFWKLETEAVLDSFMRRALNIIRTDLLDTKPHCRLVCAICEEADKQNSKHEQDYEQSIVIMGEAFMEATGDPFEAARHIAAFPPIDLSCHLFSSAALQRMNEMLVDQNSPQLPAMSDDSTRTAFVKAWWELHTCSAKQHFTITVLKQLQRHGCLPSIIGLHRAQELIDTVDGEYTALLAVMIDSFAEATEGVIFDRERHRFWGA